MRPQKFDGVENRRLDVPEVLQIGGRAGRFGTEHAGVGYVTALRRDDERELRRLFRTPLEPLTKAGLSPNIEQLQQLHYHRPKAPLSALMEFMQVFGTLDPLYFMTDTGAMEGILEHIEHVELSLHDRFLFAMAPVNKREKSQTIAALVHYAQTFATSETVELNAGFIPGPNAVPRNAHKIEHLEGLYSHLDLYVWLARRYGDTVFVHREKAQQLRAE